MQILVSLWPDRSKHMFCSPMGHCMQSHELGSLGNPERRIWISYYPIREFHYNGGLIQE
jgi:hypothetical protein